MISSGKWAARYDLVNACNAAMQNNPIFLYFLSVNKIKGVNKTNNIAEWPDGKDNPDRTVSSDTVLMRKFQSLLGSCNGRARMIACFKAKSTNSTLVIPAMVITSNTLT
jgi:hypothetical protein